MAIINNEGAISSTVQDYAVRFNGDIARGIGVDTDFEPETPQAQLAGALAASHAQLDAAIVHLYNAFNVHTATGKNLSDVAAWLGIYRLQPAPSTATVTFTGTSGSTVPASTRVRSTNGDFFTTDSDVTLSGTTGSVSVTAVENGPVPVQAGSLNALATSVAGITAVTNASVGVPGRNLENDIELRNRYFSILAFNSLGSAAALQSSILDVPGVTFCIVRDNTGTSALTVQGVSIPAHSFAAVVEGGDDAAVASAIAQRKPMGIASAGSTSQSVTHIGGFAETIRFERIQPVPVKFTIVIDSTIDYPGNATPDIKQALVDFVSGLQPGDDIDVPRARAAILNVTPAFTITTFTLTDTADNALTATNLNRRLTLALRDIDLTVN